MITFVCGPNDFAARQYVAEIVKEFTRVHGSDSVERVSGDSLAPGDLPSLLQGGTLFAPQHLIIMRQAANNKSLWDALGEIAPNIPADTHLVIVERSPDKRTRAYKQLIEHGKLQNCAEPTEQELLPWLQKVAKELGGSIDVLAAKQLMRQVGVDQWQLWQEVQKLVSYNPQVTKESIELLVEPSTQVSAFELLDAAFAGKTAQINSLLDRMQTNEDPYQLFGLMASQLHTLAIVKHAGARSADVVAKDAGAHPFVVRKSQQLARSISATQLKVIISAVANCDRQMKSTGVDPWILLRQCLGKVSDATKKSFGY